MTFTSLLSYAESVVSDAYNARVSLVAVVVVVVGTKREGGSPR